MRADGGGPAPWLLTCIGVEHDLALMPHFLNHYLDLGVRPDRICAILNARDGDSPALRAAEACLLARGAPAPERWIGAYTSDGMWERRRALQARVAAPDDWVISADVDELHEYPAPLGDFLSYCARAGIDCVDGPFIDRLAPGGQLAEVLPEPAIMAQFPIEAEVVASLGWFGRHHTHFGTVKAMAFRARLMPRRGGHGVIVPEGGTRHVFGQPLGAFPGITRPAFRFACPVRVHHFHWTAGLAERLRQRLATPGVSDAGREYGARQLDHFDRHGGIDLGSVAIRSPDPDRNWQARIARLRAEGRLRRRARGVRKAIAGLGRAAP